MEMTTTMTATKLLLLLLAFFSHSLLQRPRQPSSRSLFVYGDTLEDLWNQYMSATTTTTSDDAKSKQSSSQYESTVSRRERNLDHWDVATAAAYLGLHPKTLQTLPTSSPSQDDASNDDDDSSIDEYIGHDAAILFYAQWDRNSHAVAPSFDAIATHLHAGTKSSNLIMALFDCEKNTRHVQLCTAANIQAYPTIMFVGSGPYYDTDWVSRLLVGKEKSAGPYGSTTLRRTVKFQGNWQYGDQILDWINIMKGLSSWHRNVVESGPLRILRNGLFRFITGGGGGRSGRGVRARGGAKGGGSSSSSGSLPVGIPPHFQTELRGGGSSNSNLASSGSTTGSGSIAASDESSSKQQLNKLQKELNATIKEKELYEMAATHSNLLLDGLLFPRDTQHTDTATDSTTQQQQLQHRDPFTILTNSDGWYRNATFLPTSNKGSSSDGTTTTTATTNNNDEHPIILRSCVLELAIDYCTRLTTRSTTSYLEILNAIPESDPFPTLEEIEQYLLNDVKSQEPYCGILEYCMATNFETSTKKKEEPTTKDGENEEEQQQDCRPQKCPFKNESACTYIESCLNPDIQNEYGVALGLINKGETVMGTDWGKNGGGGTTSEEATTTTTASTSSQSNVGGWGVPVGT